MLMLMTAEHGETIQLIGKRLTIGIESVRQIIKLDFKS